MRNILTAIISLLFLTFFNIISNCTPAGAFTMDEYKAAIKHPGDVAELLISGLDDADTITSIPADIKKFKNLRKLYINNLRKLKTLPEEIGELTGLTELHMEQGNDSEPMNFALPEAIGRLENLKIFNLNGAFDLDKNPLPKSISKLSKLEELDLGRCGLKELPAQIAGLRSLKKLVLEYNQLAALPEFVSGLSPLEELNLCYTGITDLPDSFVNFKNLTVLMGNNGLKPDEQKSLADKFKNINFVFENIFDDDAANETPGASDNKSLFKSKK